MHPADQVWNGGEEQHGGEHHEIKESSAEETPEYGDIVERNEKRKDDYNKVHKH